MSDKLDEMSAGIGIGSAGPTNGVADGQVAGIGVGAQGQPPISNKPKKKKKSAHIIADMMRRRMKP